MEKNMMNPEELNNTEEKIELIAPEILDMISGSEGQSGYTCKICGQTFRTITSIACHMSSVHKNK